MSTRHSDLIPDYIKASTPKGLRSLMFRTNAKYGAEIKYFDIQSYQENGKTVWIAWFYVKTDRAEFINGQQDV